jgi:glycosyltransferase involved in cell wall biosynthesis
MKLLIFCYEYPPIGGGAGNALKYLSEAWTALGHQVTVVTSRYGDLAHEETVSGVKVLRLEVGRQRVDRGRIIEMLRYMTASIRVSEGLYQAERPDLSVAFITLPSGAAAASLQKKYRLPYVTELRGGDVPGFWPGKLNFFHRLTRYWITDIWKKSSLVLANSSGLADLARKAAPGIDVQWLANGVDTQVFAPSQNVRADRSLCKCIFVGRLVDGQKNVSRLIQAVHRLPGLELVIVGAGPDKAELQRSAAAGKGSGRVHFKGWLKGDALIRELQSADVYVSASEWEGMSNAALEALSCGLPMVLSRISGHEELVEEGQNGFMFHPASTEELSDCLVRLAGNADLRMRQGAASRCRAVEYFDWTALAAQHLDLYRQALKA